MIFKKRYNFLIFLTITISIFFYGCLSDYLDFDQYRDLTLKPSVALPIGFAHFSMGELISKVDSIIRFEEDEYGTLILVYKDSIQSPDFLGGLTIGSFSGNGSLGFDVDQMFFLPENNTIETDSFIFHLPYESGDQQRIDSMYIKSGFLELETSSQLLGDFIISLAFPNIYRENGSTLVEEILIEGSTEGNVNSSIIDLSNSFIDFSSGSNQHGINFGMKVKFISSGGNVSPFDLLSFNISSSIVSLKSIFGYLGNQKYTFPEKTIYLDFFETFSEGSINFGFPYLIINMTSSVGIPLGLEIGAFYSEISSGDIIEITGPVLDSQVYLVPVNFLLDSNLPNGQIIINQDNSSFREIFPRLPKEVIFNLEAELNPVEVRSDVNYLYDTSNVYAEYSLGMPLSLTMYNLEGTDTTELNWEEIDISQVERMAIRIRTDNGLPFGGDARILFLDQDNNINIDLFNGFEEIIVPAGTDQNGIPMFPSADSLVVDLSAEQIDRLFKSKKMVYHIIANTDNAANDVLVSITRNSFLDISVGIIGDINLKVEFN